MDNVIPLPLVEKIPPASNFRPTAPAGCADKTAQQDRNDDRTAVNRWKQVLFISYKDTFFCTYTEDTRSGLPKITILA